MSILLLEQADKFSFTKARIYTGGAVALEEGVLTGCLSSSNPDDRQIIDV
jgi:hypothetical protein